MKKFTLTVLMAAFCLTISAQRFTDQLGRGLVVSKTYNSNYLSWRRLANEYYDVTYNVYRNGTRIATNLNNTNYTDNSSSESNTYQIAAVVNGKEQEICPAKGQWGFTDLGNDKYNSHLNITLATVYDRNGNDVSNHYEPNDAEVADLDGDGEMEIILKRLNTVDAAGVNTGTKDAKGNDIYNIYPNNSTEFVVLDAYDVNWQTGAATLMWRIDCGPNMVSTNSTEINIIAYDWDEDGKAEVVLRGADNMIVYGSDGQKRLYTIGDMTVNTRGNWMSQNAAGTNISATAYTHEGAEYLIYMNGQTGTLYQQMDYPLKRLESGETDLNAAWGDGYGHRSSKYFMGAPFLNGRKASLFLGRGIYTRHKMMALDLNNHQWSTRWTWACNNSSSPWYGNGYHNFVIADVDEDGRDEIVYGSMVIDDNGKGLSTTGYQHGDAQHISDFDPYRKGLEMYACLEDGPYYGSNYRNATTSKVYYKFTSTGDDGRCLMGNFLNDYPGSQGKSSAMGNWVSSVTDKAIDGTSLMSVDNTNTGNQHLNFIIRWDGDLCSEIFDSPGGGGGAASITKPGLSNGARLSTLDGKTNNSSKNNACFVGDIIGDWRDEVIMRIDNNTIRVYTSNFNTNYSFPSLWFDHQYRQAMVWQMHAYNQPPHLSYFLGEMEGITVAPPPLTNQNRTEVANGGTISTTAKHLLMAETGDMTVTVADGAAPYMLTVNTPTWVQGTDVNGTTGTKVRGDGSIGVTNLPAITTTTYTHTLTGGAFTGSMRLVKQGDGVLVLPDVTETYTGETDVWGGTLKFNGTMANSPVWMNRHTHLYTAGTYAKSLTMEYGATLHPNSTYTNATTPDYATTNIHTLNLHEGARILFQIDATSGKSDSIHIHELNIRKQTWTNGPKYLAPVLEIQPAKPLLNGIYKLGTLAAVGQGSSLDDIIVEGCASAAKLMVEDNTLYLMVGSAETTIGSTDNTTDWWGDFSEDYTLSDGQKLHLEFRNYNAGNGAIYNNFVLVCTNDVTRNDNANAYVEHFVARADNWGWGVDWDCIDRTYTCDWDDNFVSYMNGAYVTIDATYIDGTVTVNTTVTSEDGQHTYTDRVIDNNVTDKRIRLFLTVDKCHLVVNNLTTKIIDQMWSETVFAETFDTQNADAWSINSTNGVTRSFVPTGTDTYAYEVYTTSTRTLSRNFSDNSFFTAASNYTFEFDWGTGGSNTDASTLTILSDNSEGKLLTVNIPQGWATITFVNNNGETLASYNNGRPLSTPTSLFHFKFVGNSKGVFLTITKDGSTYVDNQQISNSLCHITGINNVLGRSYNHTVFDDLILSIRCAGFGDVNLDGEVNISDVTSLVNYILGKDTTPFSEKAADVNGDGSINISDVTGLVNIILGK